MQNYNNYGNGNFRNMNNTQNVIPRNNVWNAGGYNGMGYQNDNYSMGNMNNMGNFQANNYNQPQQQSQPQSDGRIYVTGRLGADTYQLQPGVEEQILWDDDVNRFYVKGYDNKGRPRVVGDFDYFPHVENDLPQSNTDMSIYATKDDIDSLKNWLNNALKKNGKYVTQDEFNKVLSGLSVGNGGRIVRDNESDA